MPIPLTSIPEHIKSTIVQKLNLSDFVNFHESSQGCFRLAMNVRRRFFMSPSTGHEYVLGVPTRTSTRIYLRYKDEELLIKFFLSSNEREYGTKLWEYPVRFINYDVYIFYDFTEEFCSSLIDVIRCTNSTINELTLSEIACSADSFNTLIEAAKVKKLIVYQPVSPDFLRMESIQKVTKVFRSSFMSDADILSLNASEFRILSSSITSRGLNRLIKKVMAENQDFKLFSIETHQEIQKEVILNGISHVVSYCDVGEKFTMGEGANVYDLYIDIEDKGVSLQKRCSIRK